ncbi:hypothetical protein [Chamaesiphon minutus]|uniref:Uncharacterized protein n=1 Tax=Chamaesiphon minutus (strain ATCC 27169 / PCC 6605) TaxID=1173020 RepID=K9ULK9_CHAP6|nr:hypothetical protein [Chamaesiphon minutus]AFY95089.1 hypothetical protein Cha6605_4142 [Chamaesiphon minutus PCC 6605]
MNAIFPTVLKRLYRKEPISSFIIIVGAVDAVLGGVNELGTLMILGLLTSGVAIGYRWWCIQQAENRSGVPNLRQRQRKSKQLSLPPSSHRSPLPDLDTRRRPPL